MGRLTGSEIQRQVKEGAIVIDPLIPEHVGSNSVDLRLSHRIAWYSMDVELDMKSPPAVIQSVIPPDGFVLLPGKLYLGLTVERAGSHLFVPCIEGRSSVARLGIQVHMTAGFGDLGFVNRWTLEMTAVHPVRIYAGARICQIYFDTPRGSLSLYHGKYKDPSTEPVPSRMWRDWEDA